VSIPFSRRLKSAWSRGPAHSWSGHDPYDALLSPALATLHRAFGRPAGVVATQLLRRSPIDFRRWLGIPEAFNPKAGGLFLSSAARTGDMDAAIDLVRRLHDARSQGESSPCWGYPFPWQARAFYLPAHAPTVVATAFVGEAFLDADRAWPTPAYVDTALGACEFVRTRLHRTEDATGTCLSYSPFDRSAVYNASLLGARLLVLAGQRSGRPDMIEAAEPLVRYALARQRADGAWAYGEAGHHRFIDSFHTGFVLGALHVFAKATGDEATRSAVEKGARYYARTFFGPQGEPYYFAHKRYPYDIHSAAEGVIALLELSDRFPEFVDLARRVGGWMVDHMLDPEGFFYYQVRRTHTVRIPYMRWSQAWGVRALAELVSRGVER
jgi:hypothetical protein